MIWTAKLGENFISNLRNSYINIMLICISHDSGDFYNYQNVRPDMENLKYSF